MCIAIKSVLGDLFFSVKPHMMGRNFSKFTNNIHGEITSLSNLPDPMYHLL